MAAPTTAPSKRWVSIASLLLSGQPQDRLCADLPAEHAPVRVHRVDEIEEHRRLPGAKPNLPPGQVLERIDSRIERPVVVVEPINEECLPLSERRTGQLLTVCESAPVLRVRREHVREDVVFAPPVVAEEAEHLDLDGPVPDWRLAEAEVASLPGELEVLDAGFESRVLVWPTLGQFVHHKLNGLRLRVGTDPALERLLGAHADRLRAASVSPFEPGGEIGDYSGEFDGTQCFVPIICSHLGQRVVWTIP